MERIRRAIDRAKELQSGEAEAASSGAVPGAPGRAGRADHRDLFAGLQLYKTSPSILEENRILGPYRQNLFSAAFDMLRTKVVQEMSANNWRRLLLTSPTAGCGKTVTAINLAMSMAAQQDKTVILIDLDLRKPRIAADLGIMPKHDLIDVLHGKVPVEEAVFGLEIVGRNLALLATNQRVLRPVETIISQQMESLLKTLVEARADTIILIDMPPVLVSDDVLAFLPFVDCCVLSVAEGVSTVKEIESSQKLLAGTNLLGCVLTKSTEKLGAYY